LSARIYIQVRITKCKKNNYYTMHQCTNYNRGIIIIEVGWKIKTKI